MSRKIVHVVGTGTIGEPLIGKLLLYDALTMSIDTVRLKKNTNCVICGTNPTIFEPIDYEEFCNLRGVNAA